MAAKPRTILIKGGKVVLEKTVVQQDILIRGERIEALGKMDGLKADTEIDALGLLVFPGAVDSHIHFNDNFMNTISVHDYFSGTLASAYGGGTSIIDFSNQMPDGSLLDTIKAKKAEASSQALIDWGVHPVITQPTPKTLSELPLVIDQGAPTIKCYMTYRSEGLIVEDKDLKHILEKLRGCGGMLMVHAEDNDIIEKNIERLLSLGLTAPRYHALARPPEAENRAIRRCIELARETKARIFIVHMASAQGVELIGSARSEGVDIFAETCTHYLVFTDKMLERKDGLKWICSPPLRNQIIQERLWQGLQGGQISMVTSDDAAFSWSAKLLGVEGFDKCPNGIPGIEIRLTLLYSEGVAKGRISLPKMVNLISTTPAKLFGLYPQKGILCPGSEADIILFDPHQKWTMNKETLHMAADWSAYENIKVRGKVVKVFSRGELIVDGEKCLARKGRGRYLHRRLDFSLNIPN